MLTQAGNLHLEVQTSRKSPVGILRSTFRKNGKVVHAQLGRITGCSLDQLRLLQLAFREKVVPADQPQAFAIVEAKEYGACAALLQLAKDLKLDRALYSRNEPWVRDVLAMIVGRVVYAGSKLSLCHQAANSALWELCGVQGSADVEAHCYEPLDRLLSRQKAIQQTLAARHLEAGKLLLYDLTSTYFEGEYARSELVEFGYNRDRKKGHEQVVIGLLCNGQGCPVGVEVFAGSTQDAQTLVAKVQEVRDQYQLEQVIWVSDRGLLTQSNLEQLKDQQGLATITALTHRQVVALLERKVVEPELFDEQAIHEVLDPDQPGLRYCLCRNPQTAGRETQTRQRLLQLTREGLSAIAGYKKAVTVEQLGARVGKLLGRYKMGKFIRWQVQVDEAKAKSRQHQLTWQVDEDAVAAEQALDGCYIIRTEVKSQLMEAQEVVRAYKGLGVVESAFRNLKTVSLEVRPVYHKKDERIRAHVFLCMLAYYLQWHMQQRLRPLFEEDGVGKERRWTVAAVIERLKQITRNQVQLEQVRFAHVSRPDEEQQRILELLGVKL